ncbi:hypothetical protein M9H77_12626 [Catharanthus roseus]|uniref:Uncharacterized protein n=1 Tax=Catharanthus roseus TaxID=4058 RepID=A0ACC0BHY2_CATRO|nr:hypothetical protein M9H77_12626 [Catharanthus roseus]
MRPLTKGVLSLVLPEDPGMTLTSPPEVAIAKEQKKTNSTQRDKLHWENVSIAHRKIQNSSGSGSGSGSRSGSLSGSVGLAECVNGLVHRIRWQDGPAPYKHWMEIPDSFYITANVFNLCVILIAQLGSTTVLLLYLYLDRPGGTLVIGLLTEEQHFIQLQMHDGYLIPPLHVQWIHHCTERVSNWADSYQERIVDWNARVVRNRK